MRRRTGGNRMAKAVKLADIAEIVGVSIVTVSKALADKPGVGSEMRDKIKKTAKELGYMPAGGSNVNRAGLTGNVGVIIPKRFVDNTSFYWELYKRVVNSLSFNGYYAILEILEQEAEQNEEMPKMVLDHKVDGIIAIGQSDNSYIEFLRAGAKMPVMFLDFYNSQEDFDTVISDSFYGMYMLTNHLISMGHRDIGFVGTVLATSSITDRYFGYCKALAEHGYEVHKEWIINDRPLSFDDKPKEADFALPKVLPTAFACNCDISAYVLINKLKERNLKVPDDISVVGYDNYSYPDSTALPLTTYAVGMRKMADTCVDTMIKKICGEAYYRGVQIVTGHMVVRDSVKRI